MGKRKTRITEIKKKIYSIRKKGFLMFFIMVPTIYAINWETV